MQGPVGLPSVVICLGNNLAKMQIGITLPLATMLTVCWRASTMIWSYFSRHSDSCPSFSECINVDCSGVDMDFITLGIIVIACFNTVGLLLFSTIGSMSGWLLVWFLLSTGGASASGIPMTSFATCLACGVLGRCMGILYNSHMHVGFGGLMFSLAVVGGNTEVICSF